MTRLRDLFAAAVDDPHSGADLATARRLGGVMWIIAAGLTILLLAPAPPDRALGAAGWAIAALTVLTALAGARRLRDAGADVSWNELLRMSYLSIGQLALLQWLAGGGPSGVAELYLLVAALPASALALVGSALTRSIRADRGEEAERPARVDALTGLPDRRAFEEALIAEISRARRAGTLLCLVVADLDRFNAINDDHGHLAGDAGLRAVADALRDELRRHDSCFRWSGDAFALLLPGMIRPEADAACDRLAAAVRTRCRRPDGTPLTITCAATQLADGMSGDDLIRAGDAALLEVKKARRPRAVGRRHLRAVPQE